MPLDTPTTTPCDGKSSTGNDKSQRTSNTTSYTRYSKRNLHQRISVTPLSLGEKSLRQRLEHYYSIIAPDAISDEVEWVRKFDLMYKKYGGTEKGERALLGDKLCKKYGTAVRLRLIQVDSNGASSTANDNDDANDNANDNANANAATNSKSTQKEESWYDILPNQHNSGIIDFTSHKFDPIATLTLTSTTICQSNIFIQNCPLLDNISKFRPHLPECDPLRQNITKKRKYFGTGNNTIGAGIDVGTRSTNIETSSHMDDSIIQRKKRKLPILSSIASTYENQGPLSLLYKIHTKKQRIRVMIRYADCIRSTLTGYLLAFDKHMNMILRDVDEVYTPRVTKVYKNQGLSNSELEFRRRTCIKDGYEYDNVTMNDNGIDIDIDKDNNEHKKNIDNHHQNDNKMRSSPMVKVKQRHCQQLLVRGDNVVMVWRAGAERSAWPRTMISPKGSMYDNRSSSGNRMDTGTTQLRDNNVNNSSNCNDNDNNNKNNNANQGHILGGRVGTPGSLLLAIKLQKSRSNTKSRNISK